MDAAARAALLASLHIDAGALDRGGSVETLSRQLGLTPRQLRRVTRQELGVTPVQLAQTRRLLLAKQLLTDTDLPIIDVAFASGFSSLRRFNSSFKSHYRLTPRDLRHSRRLREDAFVSLTASVRPPFAWRELLAFLGARAATDVEAVEGTRYLRAVRVDARSGWLAVEGDASPDRLRVEVSSSLVPVLPQVLTKVRHLFDLGARPDVIAGSLEGDSAIGPISREIPGLRVPGAFDAFEVALRTIVGQQVSVKAATTLMGRLVAKFGHPVVTPFASITRSSPTASDIAAASATSLAACGITKKRSQAILHLARAMAEHQLELGPGLAPEPAMEQLKALPGVGDWTAQYLAMRTLRWPDAFPATDLVLRRLLGKGSTSRAIQRAESWRPWRAYGAMYAWKWASVGGG